MTKILVADDKHARSLADLILSGEGYQVIEADDGPSACEIAVRERPDLILLAMNSPNVNGLQVLHDLKSNQGTRSIPVIISIAGEDDQNAELAVRAGALDYIAKPWPPEHLSDRIRIALNRSGEAVSTGNDLIDRVLLGGVALGVLTLIEGAAGTGKSVLCQHLAYGALMSDQRVAIYVHGVTPEGQMDRMKNLGMDISFEMQAGQVSIYPLENFNIEEQGSGKGLEELRKHMESVSEQSNLIILDELSQMVRRSGPVNSMNFFNECKFTCGPELGLIIALEPTSSNKDLLEKLGNLVGTHISLKAHDSTNGAHGNSANIMEVDKVKDTNLNWANKVCFEVDPDLAISMSMGLKVVATAKTGG